MLIVSAYRSWLCSGIFRVHKTCLRIDNPAFWDRQIRRRENSWKLRYWLGMIYRLQVQWRNRLLCMITRRTACFRSSQDISAKKGSEEANIPNQVFLFLELFRPRYILYFEADSPTKPTLVRDFQSVETFSATAICPRSGVSLHRYSIHAAQFVGATNYSAFCSPVSYIWRM